MTTRAFSSTPLPSPSAEPDRYLRLTELAQYSTLSVRTLRKCIADRVHPLPAHRPFGKGKVVLVRKSEFDQWLREREDYAATVAGEAPEAMSFARRVALESRGYVVRGRR